ncbi:hypothetical protein DL93DRAFT_2229472 [Clavulina sp. PMI_390]|nr:hypothetical protein DL93DRAFT_2229472 [Clavulina sp. PMI_390]
MAPIDAGTVYNIWNVNSSLVAERDQERLKNIKGGLPHGGISQQWIVENSGFGLYCIRSAQGSQPYVTFVDPPGHEHPVVCTNNRREWRIVVDNDHRYFNIVTLDSKFCVEFKDNNGGLRLKVCDEGRPQAWMFKPILLYDHEKTPIFLLRNIQSKGSVAAISGDSQAVVSAAKSANQTETWTTEPVNKSLNLYRQVWEIRPENTNSNPELGTTVRICCHSTELSLDLELHAEDGTPILIQPLGNQADRQWLVEDAGKGLYYIRSARGIKEYLRATPNKNQLNCSSIKYAWKIIEDLDPGASGGALFIYLLRVPDQGGRSQAWVFRSIPLFNAELTPKFVMRNISTSTVADSEDTEVSGRERESGRSQIWTAEPYDKARNLYRILKTNMGGSGYLAIDGSPAQSTRLLCRGTKQIWEVRPVPSATDPKGQVVRFYYQSSNFAVELKDSGSEPDTPIILMKESTSARNQQWIIEKVEDDSD